jgi:hypothetical protein
MLFLVVYFCNPVLAVWPLMSRSGGTDDQSQLQYRRITPAPMIWQHLRKSDIHNQSIPRLEDLLSAAVANLSANATAASRNATLYRLPSKPSTAVTAENQTAGAAIRSSFLQADPLMLRNGFYLSRPMRRPAQAFVNVAVQENVQGIEGARYSNAEKVETKRLKSSFAKGVRQLLR